MAASGIVATNVLMRWSLPVEENIRFYRIGPEGQ